MAENTNLSDTAIYNVLSFLIQYLHITSHFLLGVYCSKIVMASISAPHGHWAALCWLLIFVIIYCLYEIIFCGLLLAEVDAPGTIRIIFAIIWEFFWIMTVWSICAVTLSAVKVPCSCCAVPVVIQERLATIYDVVEYNRILVNYAIRKGLKIVPRKKIIEKDKPPIDTLQYCPHCTAIKPERAVHCQICKSCVLMHDHHCVGMGTCINYGNFKAFLLIMFYMFFLAVVTMATMIPYMSILWKHANKDDYTFIKVAVCTALLVVVSLYGLGMGIFFCYELWSTSKNKLQCQTVGQPDYDLGRAIDNWKQFFGNNPFLWLLPIHTAASDGYNFPIAERKSPEIIEV